MEPTSLPALALESDYAVIPVPLPSPTTANASADAQEEEHTAEGLSPTTTTPTTASATAAAATAKIPFSVPLRFAAAPPPLLSSKDVMRGEGDVLRDVEVGTRP